MDMKHTQKIEFQEFSRAAKKKQIFGIMYVSQDEKGNLVTDLGGATIEPQVLEEAVYEYMLNSRIMGTMHLGDIEEPIQFGRIIESMVFTKEKLEALKIPLGVVYQAAWWVGYQVESDLVWQEIEKGNLPDFSLRAIANMVYEEDQNV